VLRKQSFGGTQLSNPLSFDRADLYGTVVNEGANRGILVTTSHFGPDSYDFAKDKPISLVDGPNLVAMLRKHGRRYRIDLDEARRLAKMQGSSPSHSADR
jgi:hypothetical protein